MKMSFAEKVIATLKNAKIPSNIIALILMFGKNDLIEIVHSGNIAELCKLPGIAEKRSTIIMTALKTALMNGRLSNKAEARKKAPGYSCRTFQKEEIWRDVIDEANALNEYRPEPNEDPEVRESVKERFAQFNLKLDNLFKVGLTVRENKGRIIRLNKSAISEVCKVDYESKKPADQVAILEYAVQEVFKFHPSLFSNDYEKGLELRNEYQKEIMRKVISRGVRIIHKDPVRSPEMYGLIASSPAHQKGEKGMIVKAKILKAYEDFFWFGEKLNVFATHTHETGAKRLKEMSNLLRPWMEPLKTVKGEIIRMKDILFVEDVEKTYTIKNAIRIGKQPGGLAKKGLMKELKVLIDGGIIFIVELIAYGQSSSTGLKGMSVGGLSAVIALCEKHNITIADFLNIEVKGIDGRMHRIGDFKAIAGAGCWKLDSCFENFDEYMNWLEVQSKKHEGLDVVYLLRQSEEIEDEEKVRRLTKTLIQQWMWMSAAEIRKLTRDARNDLKRAKTFAGSVKKLAALWKDPEERTAVENLFNEAPWLVMNPCIQMYLEEQWNRKLIESASCKFRTQGQYPYIMQDPVAALEVWVLGMNPDDPDLGILKEGEVSVADVPEGKELLCVRFPANFLTAKIMKNRACRKEFASLNNVMVISIHDDILIRQDGDVDGDEMCVVYDKLAIELTRRMQDKFNPPVVLFQHGDKGDKPSYNSAEEFLNGIGDALWDAKHYDGVGLYANLAMRCAYLAAVYEARGDVKRRNDALLWMAAASTGAIIAIDQVKGNVIDKSLIAWLNDIQGYVRKAFKEFAAEMGLSKMEQSTRQFPFTHFYNELAKRRPISMSVCLPVNKDNFVDQISSLILQDVGTWKDYNAQGVVWNSEAACEAVLDHSMPVEMKVKYGLVTNELIETLGDNWFKFAAKAEEVDATIETRKKLRAGTQLGFKEFMLLLWRNESSMAYSMEGRQLWEKKEEYYGVCRELIQMFLASGNWVNEYAKSFAKGYEFTMAERWTITANAVIRDALELAGNNGVDKKGSYAMFCLRVFAPEMLQNLKRNRVDNARFLVHEGIMDELIEEMDFEKAKETLELFEAAPEEVSEIPEDVPTMSDEDLLDMIAQSEEGWIPPTEEDWIPEEC